MFSRCHQKPWKQKIGDMCGYSYDFTQHAVVKSEDVRRGPIKRMPQKCRHFGHVPW